MQHAYSICFKFSESYWYNTVIVIHIGEVDLWDDAILNAENEMFPWPLALAVQCTGVLRSCMIFFLFFKERKKVNVARNLIVLRWCSTVDRTSVNNDIQVLICTCMHTHPHTPHTGRHTVTSKSWVTHAERKEKGGGGGEKQRGACLLLFVHYQYHC